MKPGIVFLMLNIILMSSVPLNAQVGSVLRSRINKAINKQVEDKIDSAVDKRVQDAEDAREDEAENRSDQDETQARERRGINIGGLMGGKVTLKYDEKYSFSNSIYMQTEIYDKKDVVKMDYHIYFGDSSPTAGFESKMIVETDEGVAPVFTSMVFDGLNKCILILNDMGSMKMGIISPVPEEGSTEYQAAENPDMVTITKTGNTKMIAGYRCDEYLYKDNESKDYGKLWVTKDVSLNADRRTWSKAGLPAYYGHSDLDGGIVLAMESYNEKNELVMKSETKEIKKNISHSISTAGYSLRQVNFNQAGRK